MLLPELPTAFQTLDLDATLLKIAKVITPVNTILRREPVSKLVCSITLLLYIRKYNWPEGYF